MSDAVEVDPWLPQMDADHPPAPCRSIAITPQVRALDQAQRQEREVRVLAWKRPAAVEDEPPPAAVAESVSPAIPPRNFRTILDAETDQEHELNELWAALSVEDRWAVLEDAMQPKR